MDLQCVSIGHVELKQSKSVTGQPSNRSKRAKKGTPHAYRLGRIFRAHSRAIEQEPHCVRLLSLPLAEGIHELLQLGGSLDLEKHFIVVVGDLDVEMLRRRRSSLVRRTRFSHLFALRFRRGGVASNSGGGLVHVWLVLAF